MVIKNAITMSIAIAKSVQSCLTLCDPIDGSPPGSPVPGILQARTLEWVTISFSSAWKWKVKVKSLSCVSLTLSNQMDCSLPGSSVHGTFQARVLEWVAIAFSLKGSTCSITTCVEMLKAWIYIDHKGVWQRNWNFEAETQAGLPPPPRGSLVLFPFCPVKEMIWSYQVT